MSDYVRRKSYLRANRYQIPIIGLTLIPTFIFCALLTVFVLFAHRELFVYLKYDISLKNIQLVNNSILFILVTIWTFFAIVYVWAKIVSGRLVGAFERITRELDRVIEGQDVDRIYAREDDYIATVLLPRINYLIKMSKSVQVVPNVNHSIGKI
ncbi:MAG: hypothetical protein AB7S78_07285 [Candidatus Omnitrophota bacterium]